LSEAPDRSAEAQSLVDSGAAPNLEYANSMLSKVAAEPAVKTVEEASAIARPEGIPEKFWDAQSGKVRQDELLKSYAELEKKLREGKPAEPEAKPEDKPADANKVTIEKKPEGEPEANPVADVLKQAGISFDDVNAEYQKNGEVSAETRAKLDTAFGKQIVDNYFAGLRAQEATILANAHEAAGGKDTFDKAIQWARQKLTDEELNSYNALVANPQTMKQGVEWLVGKFRSANPSEGSLIEAETPAQSSGDVFSGRDQMTEAMRDPRYARDPAYRQQVAEKLNRSIKAGTISTNVTHHTQRL
jgi:hypothetical protein